MKAHFLLEELLSAGEEGGDFLGYWFRGHVDKAAFVEAARLRLGPRPQGQLAIYAPTLDNVRHVWWRCVPISRQSGFYRYDEAAPHSRGAFPVTVWNYVDLWCADIRQRSESIPA